MWRSCRPRPCGKRCSSSFRRAPRYMRIPRPKHKKQPQRQAFACAPRPFCRSRVCLGHQLHPLPLAPDPHIQPVAVKHLRFDDLPAFGQLFHYPGRRQAVEHGLDVRAGSRQPRPGPLPRPPRLGAAHPRAGNAGHPQPVCAGFLPRRGTRKHLAAAHGAAGYLPFARPGARYAVQALYTGGADETTHAGEALAAPGLPLPALRGEVPGYIAWLHAQG